MRRTLSRFFEGLAATTRLATVTLRRLSASMRNSPDVRDESSEPPAAPDGPGAPPPEADAALRDSLGENPGGVGAMEEPMAAGPLRGAGPRARWKEVTTLLRRMREPVRHHEDVILAVALLTGIVIMVVHWLR